MGNLVLKGHGNDGNTKMPLYIAVAIFALIGIVLSFVLVSILANYHVGFGFGRTHGIMFFGDRLLPSGTARGILVFLVITSAISFLVKMSGNFKSSILVYEAGISGLSNSNDKFSLNYGEISSVHSNDDGFFKSININASGKIFQIYTSKCSEVAAEINKRRKL
ncbi:MAG: hypothetical protein FWB96_12360 [Defluviitaleaceae bacterium]|nr:hypothetical protein [Defluviitaleaceae bacterium]MCL2264088.1 hypothetical protein [Defluviitaleaceae bacterium]